MKLSILPLLLLFMTPMISNGQKVLDDISTATCTCFERDYVEGSTEEEMHLVLGLCLMNASKGKDKAIKKELGIDIASEDGLGELGGKVGEAMALTCPKFTEVIMAMVNAEQPAEEEPEYTESSFITGKVTGFSANEIAIVTVKHDGGEEKFYCITSFDGTDVITEGKKLIGKDVAITFEPFEYYVPSSASFEIVNKIIVITAE